MSTGEVSGRRHRVTFATRRTLAYLSVLELGRVWERALRRAGVPLKYSHGYNPRPRLVFAAPLPVGCGGEAEWLDVTLTEPMEAKALVDALRPVLPRDLEVIAAAAVPDKAPPLAEQLVAADYRVLLRGGPAPTVQEAAEALLAADEVWLARRGRRHRGRQYNLRPLVLSLRVEVATPPWTATLVMRLAARPGATGRPDAVLQAMGLAMWPRRCTRLRLLLKDETGRE